MNNLFLFLAIIVFALSCKHTDKFWDISEFNMKPTALKDDEPIKLIYTSQGPDYNRNVDYYIHVLVISQVSNDTVNILTPVLNGFSPSDGDKIFNYISPSNPAYAIMQMDEKELQNLPHIDSVKAPDKDIRKVARDPRFDYIAHNKYPTVIGGIGTMGSNK